MKRIVTGTLLGLVLAAGCSSVVPTNLESESSKGTSVALTSERSIKTTTTSSAPKLKASSYKGSGDDIVSIGDITQPALIAFTCTACTRNVMVKSDGPEGLLVNTIGSYRGVHLINIEDGALTSELEIQATGSWSVQVADVTTIRNEAGTVMGAGDDAVFINAEADKAKITYRGEGNFVVNTYGSSTSLVVNEIGSYSGTVRIDLPAFVQVISEGEWMIDLG